MMKEKTASGISGLIFSHMKACALCPSLMRFEASMASIPFSPLRWWKAVDTMLLKSSKSLHVDKLQTIFLLEADYNFNNKKLGRDVRQAGEERQLIALE